MKSFTDTHDKISAVREVMERGGSEATAPQCAGHRARQQARPHRLERSGAGPGLRSEPACSGDRLMRRPIER